MGGGTLKLPSTCLHLVRYFFLLCLTYLPKLIVLWYLFFRELRTNNFIFFMMQKIKKTNLKPHYIFPGSCEIPHFSRFKFFFSIIFPEISLIDNQSLIFLDFLHFPWPTGTLQGEQSVWYQIFISHLKCMQFITLCQLDFGQVNWMLPAQ